MTGNSRVINTVALAGWLALSYAAAAAGAVASAQAGTFYGQLVRPAWAPPGWLFGPVWTALYTLMGVAAWLVWRERGWRAQRLFGAAGGECGLDVALLRMAPGRARVRRDPSAVGADRRDDGRLLAHQAVGGGSARSLSPLGDLRVGAGVCNVEAQP